MKIATVSPAALVAAGIVCLAGAGAAFAAWAVHSEDAVLAGAVATLSQGNRPTVRVDGSVVTIAWEPTSVVAGRDVEGYRVRRYGGADGASACELLVVRENCTDADVPPGTYRYTVTPVQGSWTGPESNPSDPVVVAAPPTPGRTADAPVVVEVVAVPAWTVDAGDDGLLGPGDTLTLAGGDPSGWDGPRPVTVVSVNGTPDTITVHDAAAGGPQIGPLPIGTAYVNADGAFPGTLTVSPNGVVVTLASAPVRASPTAAAEQPTPSPYPVPSVPDEPDPDPTETPLEGPAPEPSDAPPVVESVRTGPTDVAETAEP